ncbi:hypothetical protein KIPB_016280, partial [Kipferlia bialata]
VSLYNATNGDNWIPNNWMPGNLGSDYCMWDGVGCNDQGKVVYLDLTGFNLSGFLPEDIGCLPFLKSLILNNNPDMVTQIPVGICLLQNLKYFQASFSGLLNSIPECICTMEHVQYFYVDDNALSGEIPQCIGDITFLREFHAKCNDLSGPVPESFDDLQYLEEVRVQCNDELICTPLEADIIYLCGDLPECVDCPLTPQQCPPFVEVEDCGLYFPIDA